MGEVKAGGGGGGGVMGLAAAVFGFSLSATGAALLPPLDAPLLRASGGDGGAGGDASGETGEAGEEEAETAEGEVTGDAESGEDVTNKPPMRAGPACVGDVADVCEKADVGEVCPPMRACAAMATGGAGGAGGALVGEPMSEAEPFCEVDEGEAGW